MIDRDNWKHLGLQIAVFNHSNMSGAFKTLFLKIGGYEVGPKQKVGKGRNSGRRSEKVDFYKGTFRAQTGTIVHSRNFLVLFRP